MVRRKKTSAVDDLVELLARLPWWVCVLLAFGSYWGLSRVASQPVVLAVQSGNPGILVTQTLWTTLATAGQYMLPFLCLLVAGLSAWRRWQGRNLLATVHANKAADALHGMGWREFERLVGAGFRRQGYQVLETGGGGADGGIDLVLSKPVQNGGEKYLVQCKHWRAYKVGVDVVRELYGVMAARGAAGGFVVTSGRFTDEAMRFASGRNMTLMDGPMLQGLLRQAQAGAHVCPAQAPAAAQAQPPAAPSLELVCPMCAKPMVRRIARRGVNAGNAFWGCSAYPDCCGTRPIN